MIRSPLVRTLLISAALCAAVALSGCNTDMISALPMSEKAAQPLSEKMVKDIESKNMDKDSPILVRLFKEESELEVWKQDRTGKFALLKTYPICRWSGELGPKTREGDRQAPEGFYTITPGQMNPNSAYYLSFDLGYPNAYDRAYGRTGSQLMVHGDCSSRGCYSMTDEQIAEIYSLGRDAFFGGQKSFQVQAYPFKMTAANFAKHRNNPNIAFWKMLKKGNDHFEVSGLEPKVNVCEKRYVFDAQGPNGHALSFNASGKCPAFQVPEEIASAVQDKERKDEVQIAELTRRNIATAPIKTGADGGMNTVFVEAVKKNQIGVAPQENMFVQTAPGTIPTHVRPPKIAELADAPIVAGAEPPAARPDGGPATPAAPSTAMAIAEPAKPAAKSSSFSLFSGLFGSKTADAKAADTPPAEPVVAEKKKSGTMDRVVRLVGLRKDKPLDTAADAWPKAKPAAKTVAAASSGAIKPKPADAEPVNAANVQAPAKPGAITPGPAPATTTAQATPATAVSGSAPVVPVGSFDTRWSAFR